MKDFILFALMISLAILVGAGIGYNSAMGKRLAPLEHSDGSRSWKLCDQDTAIYVLSDKDGQYRVYTWAGRCKGGSK